MGGVRTALYNYLFAKKHAGTFILRIEDTDQTRFVPGAENYISSALAWCGITIDEGVEQGGAFGPYKQSERSALYQREVENLLAAGHAYKAYDTAEEMTERRSEAEQNGSVWQYDASSRMAMKNSLSLSEEEVRALEKAEVPYVVRFKMPDTPRVVTVHDEIRGSIQVSSSVLDDKVLMKTDGLPTYHLANVVDDHCMEISHVIRGEEWLPSAPLHVLLYEAFGWTPPAFAHLPLILKPTGNGKLSKRDGDKGGFPIFPLQWTDPATGQASLGYKERGYLPEAFLNMLLLLGWSPGDDREIFSLDEAVEAFELSRVIKAGARFNPEKAIWFNEQYLRQADPKKWIPVARTLGNGIMKDWTDDDILNVLHMMLERVQFLHEILDHAYLFEAPEAFDEKLLEKKWKPETAGYLRALQADMEAIEPFESEHIESAFKAFIADRQLGFGAVLLPLRIVLTGSGGGPSMFDFAAFLGKEATLSRLNQGLERIEARA